MHCSVRQYRCDPPQVEKVLRIVDEVFAEKISQQPGFVEYRTIDCGNGDVITMTTFEDRIEAERSDQLAAEFVRDELAGIDVTREGAWLGDVRVRRSGPQYWRHA